MSDLEFPFMRDEVISALESLSDRGYQQRVWIERIMPTPMYHDDLDLTIHALFDDTEVCLNPEEWVGSVLYPSEVQVMQQLGQHFGAVIDDLGNVADADYLADPRWAEVVRLARVALITMTGATPRTAYSTDRRTVPRVVSFCCPKRAPTTMSDHMPYGSPGVTLDHIG